ncbi:hypothetical protein [Enterovirga aerilata]|nr:hypothetical protein [Enterovirga sp. DB1703]
MSTNRATRAVIARFGRFLGTLLLVGSIGTGLGYIAAKLLASL